MKKVLIQDKTLTIKPHGNNQTWAVTSAFDTEHCSAVIDFNVPGKPGPPPVDLLATIYLLEAQNSGKKNPSIQFTDPSGTLKPPTFPLNQWVMIDDK